jgi:hypothetical protein
VSLKRLSARSAVLWAARSKIDLRNRSTGNAISYVDTVDSRGERWSSEPKAGSPLTKLGIKTDLLGCFRYGASLKETLIKLRGIEPHCPKVGKGRQPVGLTGSHHRVLARFLFSIPRDKS